MDVLTEAKRAFLRRQRVELDVLAERLDISCATLRHWVGSREELLVEVAWSLAEHTVGELDRPPRRTGAERAVRLAVDFLKTVLGNPGMKHWLAHEGELAMRLLTRHDGGFQPRLVRVFLAVLREETDAGRLALPADLAEVAYVIVRIIESYTYLNLITGREPDVAKAESVLRMLLR